MKSKYLFSKKITIFMCILMFSCSPPIASGLQDDFFEPKKRTILSDMFGELQKNGAPVFVTSVLDRLLFHPAELGITRFEYRKNSSVSILKDCANLYKREGVKGIYRGLSWPLIMAFPNRFFCYGVYDASKNFFNRRETFPNWLNYLVSSSIASMTESIVLCPPEAQRIREIFGIKVLNKWDPRVLYKGYIPTLVRSGTSSITTFWGADFLLDCFDPGRESRFSSFLFGTVAGIAAQLITAPIEIIKTRIMSDYKHSRSMRWHVRDLRHSGGFGKSIISRGMLTGFRCGFIIGGMNAMKRFLEDIEPY